jgi:hypothetical protein
MCLQVTYVVRKSPGQTALNLVAQIAALLSLVLTASSLSLRGIDYLRGPAGAGPRCLRQCRLRREWCASFLCDCCPCACCKSKGSTKKPTTAASNKPDKNGDDDDDSGVTMASAASSTSP